MEISTFELLVKRIAPLTGTDLDPVARRVIQGYFLTISNLDKKDLNYRIEFTISVPGGNLNQFLLSDVARVIYDADNTEVKLFKKFGTLNVYQAFFKVPAGHTSSVQLLPKLPDNLTQNGLEVRGYVSLFLPPKFKFPRFVPQSDQAVKVLINPEIRGTFLPNNFPMDLTNLDFDQINYTLAIASGQALNFIPPEPGGRIFLDEITVSSVLEQIRNGNLSLSNLENDPSEKAQMLVELLAQIEPTEESFKQINTVMDKLDIPVRVGRN